MAQTADPQPQPGPQILLEKEFSLATSMFTTFNALSKESQPKKHEEKITRILQGLNTQHEAVRCNMLNLIQARSKFLVQKAEDELVALGDESENDDDDDVLEGTQYEIQKSNEEMLQRVRVKMREGAKAEEYEIKAGNTEFAESFSENGETSGRTRRTKHRVRKSLSNELRDLVDGGVLILEAYDTHATESTSMYQQALERRKERFGSVSGAAVPSLVATNIGRVAGAGGMPKDGYEQSPVDIRRMSTGMPIAAAAAQPIRTFENFEDVARRESTSK